MSVWIGKSKICLKTYFLWKESCKKMETLFFFQLNPLCSSISIELWGYFEYLWEDYRQCRLQNYDIPRTLDPWFSVYLYWYVGVQMNFYMSTLWKYFDNIYIFFNLHYLLLLNSIISRWNRRTETYLCYPHRCTETRLNLSEMHNTRDSDHLQHPIPVIRCLKVVFLDIWSPGICPRTPTKLSKKQNSNQHIRNYGLISY